MKQASILNFAKAILTSCGGYTVMAVSHDSTLLGELWQFRGQDGNVLRVLVKPDGTVIPSLNGEHAGHRRLEELPKSDGTYLIQVRLKKSSAEDTIVPLVSRLQSMYDESGVAGWFQVFDSEDHLTVVFERTVADDAPFISALHKQGMSMSQAACHQLGLEIREAAPKEDHLLVTLWAMLMDQQPKAQVIDPDQVLKELAKEQPAVAQVPMAIDQVQPKAVQFDADSLIQLATAAAVHAARETVLNGLSMVTNEDIASGLSPHDVQTISQVMGRILAQALGVAIEGCPATTPEFTVQMGQWRVTFNHDDPRRLYVRRNDEPGDIHLKADDDGFVVDFCDESPLPEVVGTSWCYYQEMKANQEASAGHRAAIDADQTQTTSKEAVQ